jgi:hypothetical protein
MFIHGNVLNTGAEYGHSSQHCIIYEFLILLLPLHVLSLSLYLKVLTHYLNRQTHKNQACGLAHKTDTLSFRL